MKTFACARTCFLMFVVLVTLAQDAAANTAGSLYQAWLGALGGESQQASTPAGVWVALALVVLALVMRQIGKRERKRLY